MTFAKSPERFYIQLGKRIRRYRKTRLQTHQEVGDMIGHSRASISNIENGIQRAMAHDLVTLAKGWRISLDQLMLGKHI